MATVLCLDDYPGIVEGIASLLRSDGHTVVGTWNGEKGLELLAQNPIDIIFSDHYMPIMDGYEFCTALKADPRYSNIPIVGFGEFPLSKREHLVELIKKPVKGEDLFRCIAQYCK